MAGRSGATIYRMRLYGIQSLGLEIASIVACECSLSSGPGLRTHTYAPITRAATVGTRVPSDSQELQISGSSPHQHCGVHTYEPEPGESDLIVADGLAAGPGTRSETPRSLRTRDGSSPEPGGPYRHASASLRTGPALLRAEVRCASGRDVRVRLGAVLVYCRGAVLYNRFMVADIKTVEDRRDDERVKVRVRGSSPGLGWECICQNEYRPEAGGRGGANDVGALVDGEGESKM